MTTLASDRVSAVLDKLYVDEKVKDEPAIAAIIADGRPLQEFTHKELNDLFADSYLPVQREVGDLLYMLARTKQATRIVEFGTSFAISTIFLASAVRDNGGGEVITTELMSTKARVAQENLTEAGLDDLVQIREGDALKTLSDVNGPIDLVLLDAWKDLNLPVLRLLEPVLAPGAIVIADDTHVGQDVHAPYLSHVRGAGYLSVDLPFGDGLEISMRVAD
ncbi:class I SAM-dependent methyltransferase [Streptomyces sp. NPDC048484]|uniref:O-methyltransferase n=1 Tax=Streptomyces sp. NPDC048484 TaxID=3155146 RepID=UPI0034204145